MPSTSFESGWQWPEDLPGRWNNEEDEGFRTGQAHTRRRRASTPEHDPSSDHPRTDFQPSEEQRKFWPPRTCRICLETVLPTFEPLSEHVPGIFQATPSVTYSSPDGGRLIRPCLCKGSQKYVHEGCLTAWRLQDPTSKRNYWQCPTCKYSYRLERMAWGRWISSTSAQIGLTILIFVIATFVLGYIADPIINLYLDPYGTIASVPSGGLEAIHVLDDDEDTWIEHFIKGFASLGLLGFAKFLLTLSPWHWFNMRNSGMIGGGSRGGTTGRDRVAQISWIAVMLGIMTVLWAVWKGVRVFSRRTLERASERVMDVPIPDDGDD